ncbi:unnamed protein product [Effrenium voratum]|nr:unnamed protein product [Effrenium voratum]
MRQGGKAACLAGPQHTEDSAPLGAGRGRKAREAGSEEISRGAIRTEHGSQEDSHPRRCLQRRRGDEEMLSQWLPGDQAPLPAATPPRRFSVLACKKATPRWPQRGAPRLTGLISGSGRRGRWDEVKRWLKDLKVSQLQSDIVIFSASISAAAKATRWKNSVARLLELKEGGLRSDVIVCSAVISACEKVGQWQGAASLLAALPAGQLRPNAVACNALLSACEKAFEWAAATTCLQGMMEVLLDPDLIAYSALCSSLESRGYWQPALQTAWGVRARGLKTDVVFCNAIISSMEKGCQWRFSAELLGTMRQRGHEPSHVTLNAAMSSLEKGLRWRETSALLSARGSSAEIFAYNCMMSACERCRLWTRSLDTLHSLQAVPGAPKPDVVTFTSAVGACEWREVLGLLMRMDQLDVAPNVVSQSSALSSAERGLRWPLALELLGLRDAAGGAEGEALRNDVSCNTAIIACGRGGQWQKALALLWSMQKAAVPVDLFTGTAAVWACEACGQWRQALQVLRCIPETRAKPNVFGCASDVNICEVQRRPAEGLRLLQVLSEAAMLRI